MFKRIYAQRFKRIYAQRFKRVYAQRFKRVYDQMFKRGYTQMVTNYGMLYQTCCGQTTSYIYYDFMISLALFKSIQ